MDQNSQYQGPKPPRKDKYKKPEYLKMDSSAKRNVFFFFVSFVLFINYMIGQNIIAVLNNADKIATEYITDSLNQEFDLDKYKHGDKNGHQNLSPSPDKQHDDNKKKLSPLDELIEKYTITPASLIAAQEFGGVDKETANYVWRVLTLDEELTKQVAKLIFVYENTDNANVDETLELIDGLIEVYKGKLYELDLPSYGKDNSTQTLISTRETLLSRHNNLKLALKEIDNDPKDSSDKASSLSQSIYSQTQSISTDLLDVLKQAKNY